MYAFAPHHLGAQNTQRYNKSSFGAAVTTSSSCGRYANCARAAGGQKRPSRMTAAQLNPALAAAPAQLSPG